MTFGDLLRHHRQSAGLTQESLAERAGLSVRGLSDLERGTRRAPYRDTVLRLAEALQLGDSERNMLLAVSRLQRPSMRAAVSEPTRTAPPVPLSSSVGHGHEALRTPRRALGLSQPQRRGAPAESTNTAARWERGVIAVDHLELLQLAPQGVEDPPARPMPEPVRDAARLGATSLPARPTRLIGRQTALRELRTLLSETRLLTLVGPGGVGKTRLALELASIARADCADGIVFVDLSLAHDPNLVIPLIAQALDVRDLGRVGLQPALVRSICSRQLLLVLDNFEQVVEAASQVAALLQACPGLKVVVTSREPLRLQGERLVEVLPLALPAEADLLSPEQVARAPAVALFVQRAEAVDLSFRLEATNAPAVAELCRRLDGLPLAIELAAARSRALPPGVLLERVAGCLDLLRGLRDQPPRPASLRAVLDWSFRLLSEPEQVLLRRLAVFAGGCTPEAAEAVCADDGISAESVLDLLGRLAERSLIVLERGTPHARYRLLETVREYAVEQLQASGEREMLRRRHAAWFLSLAEQAAPHIWGPDTRVWLERLEREHDNLRAALGWSVETASRQKPAEDQPTPAEVGLRLGGALMLFWDLRGRLDEGRAWLERLLALRGSAPAPGRAWVAASFAAGYVAFTLGDYDLATSRWGAALVLSRAVSDLNLQAQALVGLGAIALFRADLPRARALLQASLRLARKSGHPVAVGASLYWLGETLLASGNLEEAARVLGECLALTRRVSNVSGTACVLSSLGRMALAELDPERARAACQESLRLAEHLDDRRWVAFDVESLAWVAGLEGRAEHGAHLFGAAAALHDELGLPLVPVPEWRAWHEQAVTAARERLGSERYATAFATGRALPRAEAIALGLGPAASGSSSRVGAPVLSTREQQVAGLLAASRSHRDIARRLANSEDTAATHLLPCSPGRLGATVPKNYSLDKVDARDAE